MTDTGNPPNDDGRPWTVPPHVPAALVHDVDPYHMPGAERDVHSAWSAVANELPPVFFTPRQGGYWVLNRAPLIAEAFEDHERFASSGAISIPPMPAELPPQLPIMADPPEHRYFRMPLNLALAPRRLEELTRRARGLAIELIESFRTRGHCDFVQDFSMHLPMIIFLSLVDLPASDRQWLIARAEVMTRCEDMGRRMGAYGEIMDYLKDWVDQRSANPGDDLISRILQVRVGDRPISRQEALSESALVLFGGLDTVASTMGFCARFLAQNPGHRRKLASEPELIPAAIEELLRRWSIPSLARRVTRDLEYGGVRMKANDLVILTTCLHGLDPHFWQDPTAVDFGRQIRELMSFGRGIHKCPGALLARAEIRVFLEEWLRRIPDFELDPEDPPVTAGGGVIGMIRLPLRWQVA